MAQTNERVMEMVRKELDANPDVSTQDLFDKAKRIDSGLDDLNIRQFHARYPLQIKRRRAVSQGGGRRGGRARKSAPAAAPAAAPESASRPRRQRRARGGRATAQAGGRDDVRSILLEFAGEIASAEGKVDVVRVIGGIDGYVDRVISAAGK